MTEVACFQENGLCPWPVPLHPYAQPLESFGCALKGNMVSPLSSVQLGIESQSFLPPIDLATRPQAGQSIKEGHFMTAHRPFQIITLMTATADGMLTVCAWRCAAHCPPREGILEVDSQVAQ